MLSSEGQCLAGAAAGTFAGEAARTGRSGSPFTPV